MLFFFFYIENIEKVAFAECKTCKITAEKRYYNNWCFNIKHDSYIKMQCC